MSTCYIPKDEYLTCEAEWIGRTKSWERQYNTNLSAQIKFIVFDTP